MKCAPWSLLFLALALAQATCATGVEPPRATALVEVTEGLTVTFGQEEICWNWAEREGANKEIDPGNCEKGKDIPFLPPTTVVELEPFAIEQHEVSNIQYEYCVSMGACTPPSGYNAPGPRQQDYYEIDEFDEHPVMFVSKFQAQEYCAFVGRRLPTELEWDRVASGNPDVVPGGRRSVPTDGFDSLPACEFADVAGEFCGTTADTVPVNEPGDDYVMEGAFKIHHLFSNVSEWTADAYDILRTCKDDLPATCTSVFECSNLVDDPDYDKDRKPDHPDYQRPEDALPRTFCQQDAKLCEACEGLDPAAKFCHQGCAGEPRSYYTCVTWGEGSLPVSASQLKTGGGTYGAVRGGSVVTLDNESCHFMSDYRGTSTQKKASTGLVALGFRCAVDL